MGHIISIEKLQAQRSDFLLSYGITGAGTIFGPSSVGPDVGGAAIFGNTHYGVAQPIEYDSLLELETAAVATMLLYDEVRQVHLLCEGTDVIELICIQYLRNLDLEPCVVPVFNHYIL